MSGDRRVLQAPGTGPLVITKRRYTIPELYRLRETLSFLSCPLANFSPEAFQYLIVTPHIPASAHIDSQVRQKILQTLVKIDKERMASTPVKKVLPPHLRMRVSQPAPATAPVTLDPITPLTVVYGNLVGNETVKESEPESKPGTTKLEPDTPKCEPDTIKCEPETTQPVDRAMAEAWWAKLAGEHKIGIAEQYILEGCELPTASVHKSAAKSSLNPAVPSFNMGALREVVPNVPAIVAKQDEWGSSPLTTKQDDWNTDARTKTDDWNISPIQTTADEWGSSPAALAKPMAAPVKGDDWNITSTTSTKQDDWNIPTSSKQQDDWRTPATAFQPLISIGPEPPTAKIDEEPDKLTPPHKSAWIGLKSNGEEQDEFIRFMTAKVFPRIIQSAPKKPALDTTYVTENPDLAPADDFAAVASDSMSSDW